jgi:phosphotransferase system IIA component
MVGAGVAIEPAGGPVDAVSPVAGTLLKLHPHAFVVLTPEGTGVLVHLGIDTVRLDGAGFELLAEERDSVDAGQPVTRWDPADVVARGLSPMVMVCVLDTRAGAVSSGRTGDSVAAGDVLFAWPAPAPAPA